VSGDILLHGIAAKSVTVETVSGELLFEGRIQDGGQYSLLTHSGDIALAIPEGVNATIATATGSGDVRASFPLPSPERASRRRQTHRLGTGSATIDLETWSGDIQLLRSAEVAALLERFARARQREAERRPKPPGPPEWNFDFERR
jgi:DUF4097 and DUF4098 domain-containing protein YvlB